MLWEIILRTLDYNMGHSKTQSSYKVSQPNLHGLVFITDVVGIGLCKY